MIINGLKSPKDLYLQAKNQNMSRYGGYIYNATLLYNIESYFVFWLVLRDDNAVLISLVTKKRILSNYGGEHICCFTSKIYRIPSEFNGKNIFTKCFLCHHFIVKHNLGEYVLYCANNNIEKVYRLYFCNRSIHRG